LAVIPATYAWAGTQSLMRLPEFLIAVPLALVAGCTAGWVLRIRKTTAATDPVLWLPAFLVMPVMLGLIFHVMASIAVYGRSITPGWYLHILAAPIGFTMAVGWRWPSAQRWLAAGAVMVGVIAWGLQLSMFSGCATKNAVSKWYDLSGATCLIDWRQLDVLSMPTLGVVSVAVGLVAGIAGLLLLRQQRGAEPAPLPSSEM
jgi:hypothetical protein